MRFSFLSLKYKNFQSPLICLNSLVFKLPPAVYLA